MNNGVPDLLTADGFDEAIIGVGSRCGQPDIVVYSRDKAIEILMRDGMSYDEAVEYFEFNVAGAWVGEETPIWVYSEGEWVTDSDKDGG
tara:strand:- start:47 stop:313 length:267 start_codon:yes stop_codon:yes gene_type:complete